VRQYHRIIDSDVCDPARAQNVRLETKNLSSLTVIDAGPPIPSGSNRPEQIRVPPVATSADTGSSRSDRA
jgi:hypothetical protein